MSVCKQASSELLFSIPRRPIPSGHHLNASMVYQLRVPQTQPHTLTHQLTLLPEGSPQLTDHKNSSLP